MDTENDTTLPARGSAWPNEVKSAEMCGAMDQFVCTRAEGHDGPHVAQGSKDQVISAWHQSAMSAPTLEPDHTEPRLLTNARLALDVARTIAAFELDSFYAIDSTPYGVSAQTDDEDHAHHLAIALCRPNQDPDVNDHHDTEGGRHLWLTVGDVRVICHQPAKEEAA